MLGRGVQTGEELPVAVDEVDHREGHLGHLGHPVGEGVEIVERGVGALAEPERPQPLGADQGIAVDGREQHAAVVVPDHGRAPKPVNGAGAEVALIRCWTSVTRAPVPELAIRASQSTTGTYGPRSSAARISSGA